MNSKTVNTNKEHECGACGEIIPAGTDCYYMEDRVPEYDEEDNQIGIYYWKAWLHPYPCDAPPGCMEGNHKWTPVISNDLGAPTGQSFCKNCGILQEQTGTEADPAYHASI